MLTRYPELEHRFSLQFQPVRNDCPRMFTAAQIRQYNERGYIDPVPLFEGEELRRIQRHFLQEGRDLASLSPHVRDAGVYDVVTHSRTAAYLQDLLGGSGVICHVSEFINKPPRQEKAGSHHQDATFNAMDARCAIVWLAIDDADVENGCMWFIPGSHKLGVVACNEKHYVLDPLQYGPEQPCPVKAGHAVFMSDLVMHSSPANRSETRYRPGFTATYAPADIKPYAEAERSAVLCGGTDTHGCWRPRPRPDGPALFGA